MTILCFLQNVWVKDPDRLRNFLEHHPHLREDIIRRLLFYKCLTGRRIKECFGEDLVDQMIFEECTKEIAGDAHTICPPDLEHIFACFDKYRPNIVITFGKVAEEAVRARFIYWTLQSPRDAEGRSFIACPHPAARQKDTVEKLKAAAANIRAIYREGARDTKVSRKESREAQGGTREQ